MTVCSLFCCCLFSTTVFSQHKETIEHWQYLWICSHNCECHAQTGTRMMWLQSSGTQWKQSDKENVMKEKEKFPEMAPNVSTLHCWSVCFRQTKQKIFLLRYLKGTIIKPIRIPCLISGNMCNKSHSWASVSSRETNLLSIY